MNKITNLHLVIGTILMLVLLAGPGCSRRQHSIEPKPSTAAGAQSTATADFSNDLASGSRLIYVDITASTDAKDTNRGAVDVRTKQWFRSLLVLKDTIQLGQSLIVAVTGKVSGAPRIVAQYWRDPNERRSDDDLSFSKFRHSLENAPIAEWSRECQESGILEDVAFLSDRASALTVSKVKPRLIILSDLRQYSKNVSTQNLFEEPAQSIAARVPAVHAADLANLRIIYDDPNAANGRLNSERTEKLLVAMKAVFRFWRVPDITIERRF